MITWTLSFFIFMMLMFLMYSNNPMKASFMILMASSMMFMSIKLKMGTIWMPMIFFILFTGGILMMFMILSSIMPNEKAQKMKAPKWGLVLAFLILSICSKTTELSNLAPHMKSFLSSSLLFIFMMVMILIYFFGSINLNKSESSSMRSLQC